MAVFTFPTPTRSNETQQVTLSGTLYTLHWLWNERDARWYLSMALSDGTPVLHGVRVVLGWDLLASVVNANRPPGAILFFDQSTAADTLRGADPGLDDFGDRVVGFYVT